jgi:hypothetical protein
MLVAGLRDAPALSGPPLRAAILVFGWTCFATDFGSGLALSVLKALLTITLAITTWTTI